MAALDEFVAEVSGRSDILSVVGNYVRLKKKGGRYWGCCPFHNENTPSFSVVPDKGFFYCFGCHAGGNVFKFISLVENISYFDAVKLQAEKLGIALPARKKSPAEIARDEKRAELFKVNELAKNFFHNCLTVTKTGKRGRDYFAARRMTKETIEEFSLGYAPDAWEKLTSAFLQRGIKKELLVEAGLAVQREKGGLYDRFRSRVMIPIADERGYTVGFGGRVLDDSTPKYLNTAETPVFNKRQLLFGLNLAKNFIRRENGVIIVEGYMDAVSLFGAGIKNVAATLGTAFTAEHLKLLLRYTGNIYFCYDSDEAGQKATVRAISLMRGTDVNARVIVVPDGKDPDEYIKNHGADAFAALVKNAEGLIEYRLKYILKRTDFSTLSGKLEALSASLPVFASIRSDAERSEYIKNFASKLMLDESSVRSELKKYLKTPAEAAPQIIPERKAARKRDDANRRAGRIILRAAYKEPSLLTHIDAMLPNGLPDESQQEALNFLKSREKTESPPDEHAMETLSETASAELSRSLVEEADGDEALMYSDSVNRLRRTYLEGLYHEHGRLAEQYYRAGNDESYRAEVAELKKLSDEINELKSA